MFLDRYTFFTTCFLERWPDRKSARIFLHTTCAPMGREAASEPGCVCVRAQTASVASEESISTNNAFACRRRTRLPRRESVSRNDRHSRSRHPQHVFSVSIHLTTTRLSILITVLTTISDVSDREFDIHIYFRPTATATATYK